MDDTHKDTEARRLYDTVRLAEQQRIRNGEDLFASDLVDVLSPERIVEGVSLDFQTDGDLFRDTLDILGLHTAIDTGRLHIRRAMNLNRGVSSIGSVIKPITGQNLKTALAMMQTDQWMTHQDDDRYSRVEMTTPDAVTSVIILAAPDREHDGYSDLTQPIVVLSAQYRYAPQVDSEFTGLDSAAELVRHAHAPKRNAGEKIAVLAESLRDEEARLLMPGASYRLEMGMRESAFGWSMAEGACVAHAHIVRSGRIFTDANQKD